MSQFIFYIFISRKIFDPLELGVFSYYNQITKANEYSSEILSKFGAPLTTEDPLPELLLLKLTQLSLESTDGGQVFCMRCSKFSKELVDPRKHTANS